MDGPRGRPSVFQTLRWYNNKCRHKWSCKYLEENIPKGKPMGHSGHALFCRMHRASCRFMPPCGITETLSDVESVRVVHFKKYIYILWKFSYYRIHVMIRLIGGISGFYRYLYRKNISFLMRRDLGWVKKGSFL